MLKGIQTQDAVVKRLRPRWHSISNDVITLLLKSKPVILYSEINPLPSHDVDTPWKPLDFLMFSGGTDKA